jgi:FtsP/CotA-like multicopper oxidase with cupredoxin domain
MTMRFVSRRTILRAGLAVAGTGVLAACTDDEATRAGFVAPDGDEVRAAEARRNPGTVRDVKLSAAVGSVDLGGTTVTTWTYGGALPGAPIRVKAGEVLRATIHNGLPGDTSVHWHGVALRNDADGVPHLTQKPIAAGSEFTYQFTVPHPGTYWFHPHVGPQLDRGLYAPLIVDDPAEPLAYDDEWVIVLDDWLDDITGSPDNVLAELRQGMGNMRGGGHMMMGASSSLLGGDAGDVRYPHFLLNGRLPAALVTFQSRPGSRVRLRIINAGGDTAFRVALGGHRMQVTHTDGLPVQPIDTDALLVGMGERYDALVTLADGVFPLVALAEGKAAAAYALVRTGSGTPPPPMRPREIDGRIVAYRQLRPNDAVRLATRDPDRAITLKLTGGMMALRLGVQRPTPRRRPLRTRPGRGTGTAGPDQHHNDVAPGPPTRPHLRGRSDRPAQRHRHRPTRTDNAGSLRRRQPRPLDGPLPQHLPRRGRHDDPARLPALTGSCSAVWRDEG